VFIKPRANDDRDWSNTEPIRPKPMCETPTRKRHLVFPINTNNDCTVTIPESFAFYFQKAIAISTVATEDVGAPPKTSRRWPI